jgi:hypothetical protein
MLATALNTDFANRNAAIINNQLESRHQTQINEALRLKLFGSSSQNWEDFTDSYLNFLMI